MMLAAAAAGARMRGLDAEHVSLAIRIAAMGIARPNYWCLRDPGRRHPQHPGADIRSDCA
jgi:hypothetical protein